MNNRFMAGTCLLVFFILGVAIPTNGQVTTGTPPFGSFGGGPDVINLANLNAHLSVPVLKKAGRGMSFDFNLTYDSSVWYPVTSSGTTSWQNMTATTWGWTTSIPRIGILEPESASYNLYLCPGGLSSYTISFFSNWTYFDGFGTPHPFGGTTEVDTGCSGNGFSTSINSTATDGSGYTVSITGYTLNSLVAADGAQITLSGVTLQDKNGNKITENTSGQYFDTLSSTTPVLTATGSGTPSSPVKFTYTAPSGASAAYTMKYAAFTVRTNFGCSGIVEYGPTSRNLVTEVDLPDIGVNPNDKYTFTYEPTPGYSGDYTGRIASVTLPTGGTVAYSYSGGSKGIVCADGSTATLTRTTPDGKWTYAHSENGTAWTTTVTDPQNDVSTLNFQGLYETERRDYAGSTTLLRTLTTCYNGTIANCNSAAVNLPISQRTAFLQWPGTSGQESRFDSFYNALGLFTEKKEYAYGAGAAGAVARTTLVTYASLGNGIANRPATITVEDASGTVKSKSTYSYDQTAVIATSGTPQHVSISGSRGNISTISYQTSASSSLSSTFTYYDTGNLATAHDVNGATRTYTYGACGNSLITNVSEPLSLSLSMTWNCSGGVETAITDENGKIATSTYHADHYFWRPDATTDQLSNAINFTYNEQTSIESTKVFNGGLSSTDVLITADSLGRSYISQVREAPSSTTFDSIESDYDSMGRPSRITQPFASTAGSPNPTAPGSSTLYDALSRKTQISDTGGRVISYAYTQNDFLRTLGPAPPGENAKQRQLEYDSMGRLTSVCEVTSVTGSGNCAQTSPATGFWTKYTYDPLDHLVTVSQNAQSSTPQVRSYAYDNIGRMISESNPESGTTSYMYDSDTTCGTSHGDLVKKVDAVGNVVCYVHDALHRTTQMNYSGPYSSVTPTRYYVFDSATVNGVSMANTKMRLADAYTATCSTCAKITDLGFSYSGLGRVSDVYELTPNSGGYYHVTSTYWPNGTVEQLSNLSSLPTITYNVDGEGRVYSVSASSGQNPLLSTTYNVASKPTQINLGSSDSDSFGYDANTNQMTQYEFTVNGQSIIGVPTWSAIHTLSSLTITDPFNASNNQSCNYSHDDLSRIASVNCGAIWSQTFSYDPFGNISKSGSSSFQPSYSPSTNRMTLIGGSAPTYDANGNVTNDFLHAYAWNADGRPVIVDGVGITYDALGRMVEQNRTGVYTQILYSPTGAKLALMNGTVLQKGFVRLSGGAMAVYNSSGLAYYRHSDWIGSSRFASTPTRAMYYDGAYAPFGEPYAQTGNTDLSFTGMNQDTVPNLYDFPQREYGVQGRWPSPDPLGFFSVHLKDPQTLNRYAYVRNSPASLVDPTGACDAPPGGNGVCVSLYIPTLFVPGGFPLLNGIGDDRGPDGDGGSFREQYEITYDPASGLVQVNSETGVSQVDFAGETLSNAGTIEGNITATYNSDGSVTVNIDTSAENGFANYPGAPSGTIDASLSITINIDGNASVSPDSTYSGYPSLEIWQYQAGQDPNLLVDIQAGFIDSLGTNDTVVGDQLDDSPTTGGEGDEGGGCCGGDDGDGPFNTIDQPIDAVLRVDLGWRCDNRNNNRERPTISLDRSSEISELEADKFSDTCSMGNLHVPPN